MPDTHKPRSGSMQFWPRKRSSREHPRIRSWAASDKATPLCFAGYKVGMTHVMATDSRKSSTTAGEEIPYSATVIECPPMQIASVRFYKKNPWHVVKEIFVGNYKELKRKLKVPKSKTPSLDFNDYDGLTILVHTMPDKTNIGKKKPELFEVEIGGSKEEKLAFVKENIGKDIEVGSIFSEGEVVDIRAITKGKGYQGPVRRFGIGLKNHKSEKGRRRPGSLGGWSGQQHFMYRVPMAGQHGYHQRTQYNSQILKVGDNPEEINVSGGFKKYGVVKNKYIFIRGSVPGPSKRLIVLTKALRKKNITLPAIQYISTSSKQGR